MVNTILIKTFVRMYVTKILQKKNDLKKEKK